MKNSLMRWLYLLVVGLLCSAALVRTQASVRLFPTGVDYDGWNRARVVYDAVLQPKPGYDEASVFPIYEEMDSSVRRSFFSGFAEFLAAEGGKRTFFSVQSEADAARLASGGAPWPTGLQRANLGEGLYAWGNQADAAAYAANKPGSVIMQFNMSASDYSSLNTLDMRTMSDEAATGQAGRASRGQVVSFIIPPTPAMRQQSGRCRTTVGPKNNLPSV